jgi:spore coat protein E
MGSAKEIVTKAVILKGKKSFKDNYSIDIDNNASTILGCWIINHKFQGNIKNEEVIVNGSYDVNIWYSSDNDTKTNVINKTINYNENIDLKSKTDIDYLDSEIIVKALKQPVCNNVIIKDNKINFDVEKELGIEVVGDTKVKIMVEDLDDDYIIFDDKVNDAVLNDIDNNVKEDFIN